MKKGLWMLFLALAGSWLFSITALAGDINSAEQGIINAISGTYEYNGELYRVTDSYIAQVVEYLSRDTIDMTDAQAEGYIAQFQANIATGIASGYMQKVENTGDGNESGSGTSGSGNTPASPKPAGGGNTSENGNTSTDGNTSADGNSATGSNPILGTLTPADGETGVIEDNTVGSITDGEIEYTVFEMDNETMYVWDIDALDVHKEAYKDSEVIGTLNKGDSVVVTGAATTGWARIEYNGAVGYISAVYLRTQGYIDSLKAEEEKSEEETSEDEAEKEEKTDASGEEELKEDLETEAKDSDTSEGEDETQKEPKDYSDAAPVHKSLNIGAIAIVIVIVLLIGSGGVILWHRNKTRKR